MLRKVFFVIVGFVMGTISMIMFQSYASNSTLKEESAPQDYKSLMLLGDVYERVSNLYVTKPDKTKLIEDALHGMVSSLDPHSAYMNKKETEDLKISTTGQFGGLGIEVTLENGLVKVISPIDGTPAEKAGIHAGDLITKIDNVPVYNLSLNKAVDSMRGKAGTPINLTIIRKGVSKQLHMRLVRAIIKVNAVRYEIKKDIGYIRIISFTEQTERQLKKAISEIQSKLSSKNLKGYILDLRLNSGGLLDQAVRVSDAFLKEGEIVSTRGRNPSNDFHFYAQSGDLINGLPIIVLINGGTASAAEIVAGALKDHHRATILGTRSFGKGSVQTLIPLSNEDGSLRLTTALYYTPSGQSIQGKGISPDIVIQEPLPEGVDKDLYTLAESDLSGHIKGNQETENGSGSIAYVPKEPEKDTQLCAALKLLRKELKDDHFPPKIQDNRLSEKMKASVL